MARRGNRSPLVSFALFLVVCGMGWVAWENRDKLRTEKEAPVMEMDTRDRIEDEISEEYEHDACFFALRGHLNWRHNEHRYKLDILVEESEGCEKRAKGICERIAKYINAQTERPATVTAYDGSGREVGRFVL